MLILQKSAFDWTDLANKNLDKGKSILRAPPKQDKKEAKNPRAKKAKS